MNYKWRLVNVKELGHHCPDCGHPLSKSDVRGKFQCTNPSCTVISVTYWRRKSLGGITRIVRAAVAC